MGVKNAIKKLFNVFGLDIIQAKGNAYDHFSTLWYTRHNKRRQEHLASLGLDLHGKSVLEVGAGIGDHTSFWTDRNCDVLITEARDENITILKERYPDNRIMKLNLDNVNSLKLNERFEIVYCYGTLYHLKNPATALRFLADHCSGMLLLETCVSHGDDSSLNPIDEIAEMPTQAVSGVGCRPTRRWVVEELQKYFLSVYVTKTQPSHPEFPPDWKTPAKLDLSRAVFIASRQEIDNVLLSQVIPDRQFLSNLEVI